MRSTARYWTIAALDVWRAAYLQAQALREQQAAIDSNRVYEQGATVTQGSVKAPAALLCTNKTKTTNASTATVVKRA